MSTGLLRPRTSPNGTPKAAAEAPGAGRLPAQVAVRRRRRPAVMVAAVMLAAAGAGIAATTAIAAGHRVPVLALARNVPMGATLTADDLRVARVAHDPALQPIGADARAQVVGRHAATSLSAGTLLTESMLTDTFAPGPGQALVAVALKPGEMPARPLMAGDHVLAVTGVDASTDAGPSSAGGSTLPVVVADVGRETPDGTVVVDVVVASSDAASLAREAAAGRVALVLLGPAGG
jgi:hypothetical protein